MHYTEPLYSRKNISDSTYYIYIKLVIIYHKLSQTGGYYRTEKSEGR